MGDMGNDRISFPSENGAPTGVLNKPHEHQQRLKDEDGESDDSPTKECSVTSRRGQFY